MLFQIDIRDIQKGLSHSFLFWRNVRLGSGLGSQFLFLESHIPKTLGWIRWKGFSPVFVSANDPKKRANLCKRAVSFSGYRIRAKINPDLFLLLPIIFVIALVWMPFSKEESNLTERVYTLPAKAAFGRIATVDPPLDSVSFSFEWKKGPAALHFSSGNIQAEQELQVFVNGELFGFSEPSPRGWSEPQEIDIHADLLREGENRLTFKGRNFAKEERFWGVREVFLEPRKTTGGLKQEDAPKADADQKFLLSESLFEKRLTKPGYLSYARKNLEEAMETWVLERKEVPKKARELLEEIDRAETSLISQAKSQALSAMRLGRHEDAKNIYFRLLQEFPRSKDPRRFEIQEKLRSIP